jgi:hypothetical protein
MIDFVILKILQDFPDFVGIGNLVKVAENDDVLIRAAGKPPCHRILLEGVPLVRTARRGVINDHMDNLILKFGEHCLIFFIIQGLFQTGKGLCRLADYKPVHYRAKDIQPDFQDIQLIKKLKAIVYHLS